MKALLLYLFSYQLLMAQDFTFDPIKGDSIPNYIAEVDIFKGDVKKQSPSSKAEVVHVGTRFFKNDVLLTGPRSFVKLKIVDESQISLGPNSELNFSHFEFKSKSDRKIIYSFIKGQLSGEVKNTNDKEDVVVKTKTAAMGIRGTQFYVNYHEVDANQISDFALVEGKVNITDANGKITPITQYERLITVQDKNNKNAGKEKLKLSQDEVVFLQNKVEDSQDFKNLMPYFKHESVPEGSSLYTFFNAKISTKDTDSMQQVEDSQDDEQWRKKLEQLNQKLRENQ
ncbi:MAG: FecR domain-containing protein [Bacteriovoracaceae bacterium]|nr:FecR domain-containing protein [Bacteriovoracaceae bacterium]